MKKFLPILSAIILLAAACNTSVPQPPVSKQEPTITQGLYGTVTLRSGDCMPGIAIERDCSTKGIATKIYIRQPATGKNMKVEYLNTPTPLVKEVTSSDNGFYEASLPAGTYSVFVDDDGKEYCNFGDGQGNMCMVTIGKGLTKFNPQINHATD